MKVVQLITELISLLVTYKINVLAYFCRPLNSRGYEKFRNLARSRILLGQDNFHVVSSKPFIMLEHF